MSLEASGLKVVVESVGINQATDALNKLAVAGDKAEKSTAKLSKANKGAEASAKQQEKLWYDLLAKSAKFYEQQYSAQQRHNNRLYGLVQAEANKLNRVYDRQVSQDAASFAKRRAQEQSQLEALDTMRHKAAAKEYARAQQEATRMNALLERQRKQQEAAAKTSAERQRVLNSNYSASSLAQQISTLQRAQQFGAQGGNVSQRFGSQVGGASSSGELERLQRQYRQLQMEAARANRTMADTHAAVRGLSGSLGALWMTYGSLLPLLAGAAVGAAIKGIVDVGADIEHTLEKIRVLGQATTGEIDQMRQKVLELGKGVQGPRDVAQAFQVLTLAGLNAKEAMQGVGAALNLAIAGDVSIEKASTTLVQISTSLGYAAQDFDHIADVIAKTAAVSMSSVDSISGAFLSAAAVGEVYGASLQDIGLGLATVANLGIQATAAGTTLKNFYADLSKGTDKSTKALKDMGMSLRDLKTEDGGFINLVDLVYKLEKGFSKLNPQARAEAMDKLFGERGIKTGAALIQMVNQVSDEVDAFGNNYKNRLEEVADQINKSAAFSTLAAIAMAQTTNNQLKSVANTLQTALGSAFASVAPQISVVARELKAAFSSPEFANGIRAIAVGVADLTKAIVTNFDWIIKLVAAYAAFKVTMFAAGLVQLAQGFTIATVAARAFTISLGPIGVAIAGLTALWAIYKAAKNDALNNTAGSQNLSDYADGVIKAAETENEVAELRKKGASEIDIARKRQMEDDKNAAAAAIKISKKGVDDMRGQLDADLGNLSEYQKKRVQLVKSGQAQFTGDSDSQKYIEKEKAYTNALQTHNNQVKIVTAATENLIRTRQKNGELADKQARQNRIKPTGDGDISSPESEKAAAKAVKFVQNEALELAKLTAGYQAKNAAMLKSIELGKAVMAETQQALVLENLMAGKYGSNKSETNEVYLKQKKLALAADEAKAENERLKKVTEFANKLSGLEAAQDEYSKTAIDGSLTHFGALRKEAEEVIKLNSLYGEAADKLRMRADAMDVYKRQQEDIAKLEKATDSANARAGSADDEAENMLKFGVRAKATAMQLAELYIQKMKLDTAGSLVAANMLREASATEQLSDAYRDLVKEQLDLEYDLEKAQADSLTMFGQNEMEKVRIVEESQRKQAALKMSAAQDAFDSKAMSGTATFEDVAKINAANKAYAKTLETISKIAGVKMGVILTKDEIDRWKDFANTIENALSGAFGKAGEAAGKMFGLLGQNQARELTVAKQISAVQESNYLTKEEKEREIDRLQHRSAVDRIGEYAGMADAAKGFFDEGSRGYNAMTKASKVLHAAEVALSLIKGVNAVLTQGSGDPYSAFARMAAMAALVAGLGVALSGGGGGMSSKDKQSIQGTGSVLGSSTVTKGNKVELVGAKSESIKNSLDILQRNSGLGLVKQDGLLNAMRSLSNGIAKLAVNVVRNVDLSGDGIVADSNSDAGAKKLEMIFAGGFDLVTKLLGGDNFITKFTNKLGNAIFGGKKTVTDTGFSISPTSIAQALAGGVSAFQYADIKKDGGLFRSDKYSTEKQGVDKSVNADITRVFEDMYKTLTSAADIIGVGGDEFTKKLQSFVIDIGEISLKGLSGEEIEKELEAVFSKVGDQFASFAFSDLNQYQKIGEGMLETVARVANELLQVKDVFTVLGKSLPSGMAAVAMTQKIVEAFGGIENVTSGVSDYMQNILTEEQRLAITTKSVTDAMTGMGLASVTTRDQFKAVVDGLDLTKDADVALFRSLVGLSAQFGQVVDASDKAANAAKDLAQAEKERLEGILSQRLELEGKIAELTNNSAEAARVLSAQRAIELAKLDESLQPLQTRVWMLEDEASAADKANDAADKLKETLKEMFDEALNNAETAYGRLSTSVEAQKEIVNKSYDEMIDAAQKAGAAAKETAQLQLDAAQKQRDSISNVLSMLDNSLKSTNVDTFDLTRQRRMEAQSYLQMASIQASSGGSVSNLGGLESALEAISKPSEDLFATFEDYARDQAGTQNVLENLRNSTQTQLTAAELTINALNDTIDAIEKQTTDTISQLEANRQSELSALDKILEQAQSQLDALKGIDNSVLTLSQAMTNFASQIVIANAMKGQAISGGAMPATPTPAGGAGGNLSAAQQIANMYQTTLGRAPDSSGFMFYLDNVLTGKTTLADVELSLKNSAEANLIKNVPKFDVGTNFVPSDMLAMVHKGERIIPAADNAEIKRRISSEESSSEVGDMKAAFNELKQVIITGDVANVQVSKELLRIFKKFDQDGLPETRNEEDVQSAVA